MGLKSAPSFITARREVLFGAPLPGLNPTGRNRLVVQMLVQIRRQPVGCLVAPGPVLLQALPHDPVQIPTPLGCETAETVGATAENYVAGARSLLAALRERNQ